LTLRHVFGVAALIAALAAPAHAMPYLEHGETRYSFSQTTLGTETLTDGQGRLTPGLSIGATHFWGHADIYVKFALGPYNMPEATDGRWRRGVETGASYFPWRIDYGRPAPFVGLSWLSGSYVPQFNGQAGPLIDVHRVPVKLGLNWLTHGGLWELGGEWLPFNTITAPLPAGTRDVSLPAFAVWLGYKYVFDMTIHEEPQRPAIEARNAEKLARHELNDLFLAVGPSSAFTLGASDYNAGFRPQAGSHVPSVNMPEFALGYQVQDWDAAFVLNYRHIEQDQLAYGLTQRYGRRTIGLEGLKFFWDYQGFTPFLGAGIGHQALSFSELENGAKLTDVSGDRWSPYLVFGWDIRPHIGVPFLLRTNLRYTPALGLQVNGRDVPYDHLEFNFIQMVLYPKRLF
jgi:hypothetical protein